MPCAPFFLMGSPSEDSTLATEEHVGARAGCSPIHSGHFAQNTGRYTHRQTHQLKRVIRLRIESPEGASSIMVMTHLRMYSPNELERFNKLDLKAPQMIREHQPE